MHTYAGNMRKLMTIMEADIQYTGPIKTGIEYMATKTKDAITKVTALLRGHESASVTRLINNFRKIEELEEQINKAKEELKQDLRTTVAEIFNPEDAVSTRVVETCRFIIQISKDPVRASTTQWAKVIEELEKELTPELAERLKEIRNKYTTLQSAKPPSVNKIIDKNAPKTESIVSEGFMDVVKKAWSMFSAKLNRWLTGYDARLDKLKASMGVTESSDDVVEAFERWPRTPETKIADLQTEIEVMLGKIDELNLQIENLTLQIENMPDADGMEIQQEIKRLEDEIQIYQDTINAYRNNISIQQNNMNKSVEIEMVEEIDDTYSSTVSSLDDINRRIQSLNAHMGIPTKR